MENADLGQVFTKRAVADYMVELFTLPAASRILDPCFGQGVFIESLYEKTSHTIVGVELDERLYGRLEQRCTGELAHRCTVFRGDFLKFQDEERFDGILMNPPYIRQEKIDELSIYGINKVDIRKDALYSNLPSNANMYMYFVIKGISLLRPGGEMVVIFPGTWQRSASGEGFLQALRQQCNIVRTITVLGPAFETDALVDVVILKLVKDKKAACMPPERLRIGADDGGTRGASKDDESECGALTPGRVKRGEIKRGALTPDEIKRSGISGAGANLAGGVFSAAPGMMPFSQAAAVRRGLTTGNNAMFVNPQKHGYNGSRTVLTPLISSPKSIRGYTTDGCKTDDLLLIDEKRRQIPEVAAYLKYWREKIIGEKKPKTLYERIISGDERWYRQSEIRAEGLLFGYIVRNEMKFIDALSPYIVRDNFYIIRPLIDPDLLFALLNNYYTYYQLECRGKHYGAGVLKLQKYDLESLYLIDAARITAQDKEMLINYVNLLRDTADVSYVDRITQVLGSYGPVDAENVKEMYENAKRKRLEVNV